MPTSRNIDRLQERFLADNAYQGSVVLMARHCKVCYFEAFGKADEGVEMATDSIFRLASMSKVVAAAAVLQLFERGLIALHEPLSVHLPEFADPKVAVVKDWQVTQPAPPAANSPRTTLLTMTGS
ncbi:MAG: serine hydrolase domain-containing protein [Micropruina sp.]